MKDFKEYITEAPKTGRRLRRLTDIKVGDIFVQMRGHGDQMPEFYMVKSLDNAYTMEAGKGEKIGVLNINFVQVESKLKPTKGYFEMAGLAVPDLKKPQEVGRTILGSAREYSLGKKDSMVMVTIVMGRDVPKAQLWDGNPVPYTAWG